MLSIDYQDHKLMSHHWRLSINFLSTKKLIPLWQNVVTHEVQISNISSSTFSHKGISFGSNFSHSLLIFLPSMCFKSSCLAQPPSYKKFPLKTILLSIFVTSFSQTLTNQLNCSRSIELWAVRGFGVPLVQVNPV